MSGGFAGLIRGAELDGSELSGAERTALSRALRSAKSSRSTEARDMQVYELEVLTDSGTQHLEFDDSHDPGALADLIARLMQRSRPVAP